MTAPLARVPKDAHGWLRLVTGEIVEVTATSGGHRTSTTRHRHRAEAGVATTGGTGRATTTDAGADALRLAVTRAAAAVVPGRVRPPAPPETAESHDFADPRPFTPAEVADQVTALASLLAAATVPDLRWTVRAHTARETSRRTDTAGMAVVEETTRAWLHARLTTPAGAVTITGGFARHPADLDPAEIAAAALAALATGKPWSSPLQPDLVTWSPAATARLLTLLTPRLLSPTPTPGPAPTSGPGPGPKIAATLQELVLSGEQQKAAASVAPIEDAPGAGHSRPAPASAVTLVDDPWHRTGPLSSTFDTDGFRTARRLLIDRGRHQPPRGRTGPATNLMLARHGDQAPPGDCLRIDELHDAALGGADRDTIHAGFTGGRITGGRTHPVRGLLAITVTDLLAGVHGVAGPARFLLDLAGADAATLLTAPGARLRLRLG
ncbi:hypothetical protein F4553_007496 [Allocatelliglobosispora scoriae]|uniref:TldD/PmbA family protein n=1 Tax=Allocatelliglobosispora scoriae TaxID=643052 RepID=A0A841C4S0_9ACTN|nr:hypothetical protein [Allocatelliglobosispora scoriae]MBB5874062.1 hypothetical protein [Allocatelliglobosispora scoriae]